MNSRKTSRLQVEEYRCEGLARDHAFNNAMFHGPATNECIKKEQKVGKDTALDHFHTAGLHQTKHQSLHFRLYRQYGITIITRLLFHVNTSIPILSHQQSAIHLLPSTRCLDARPNMHVTPLFFRPRRSVMP